MRGGLLSRSNNLLNSAEATMMSCRNDFLLSRLLLYLALPDLACVLPLTSWMWDAICRHHHCISAMSSFFFLALVPDAPPFNPAARTFRQSHTAELVITSLMPDAKTTVEGIPHVLRVLLHPEVKGPSHPPSRSWLISRKKEKTLKVNTNAVSPSDDETNLAIRGIAVCRREGGTLGYFRGAGSDLLEEKIKCHKSHKARVLSSL
jgi:hypothetical protein